MRANGEGEGFAELGDVRPLESRCAAEPIHTPGTIQPHGILLAVETGPDLRVVAASANSGCLTGGETGVLGRAVEDVLGAAFAAELAQRAASDRLAPPMIWASAVVSGGGDV